MIVIDALRHLDPNPSAAQVRDYIARLKGFAGINGLYDFPKIPQRGLDIDDVVVTLWSPTRQTWETRQRTDGNPARQINSVPTDGKVPIEREWHAKPASIRRMPGFNASRHFDGQATFSGLWRSP